MTRLHSICPLITTYVLSQQTCVPLLGPKEIHAFKNIIFNLLMHIRTVRSVCQCRVWKTVLQHVTFTYGKMTVNQYLSVM